MQEGEYVAATREGRGGKGRRAFVSDCWTLKVTSISSPVPSFFLSGQESRPFEHTPYSESQARSVGLGRSLAVDRAFRAPKKVGRGGGAKVKSGPDTG